MNIDILDKEQLTLLLSFLSEAKRAVVIGHKSPDGDALGACLSWAGFLRSQYGIDATVVVPDAYPDFLHWLPDNQTVVRYDKKEDEVKSLLSEADCIFCLDMNTPSRVGDMAELLTSSKAKKVMIDHHLYPDMETALTISHPDMCSTCELVFRIVWQLGKFDAMDSKWATQVYCGMMTDTGGFTFNSTRPEIFFIISNLLTKGIDKDKIYRNVYNNYSESRMRLTGYVLYNQLVVDKERHATYFTLTRKDLQRFHFIKGDAEGLVNMPLQIKGVKLSISLREDTEKDNTIWVSLRSVDDFPCNKVAEAFFNGGGHLNASGGRLHCSMAEAVEVTKKAIAHFENTLK